jgi:hypothetical protein
MYRIFEKNDSQWTAITSSCISLVSYDFLAVLSVSIVCSWLVCAVVLPDRPVYQLNLQTSGAGDVLMYV